jgi:hypothetical protein
MFENKLLSPGEPCPRWSEDITANLESRSRGWFTDKRRTARARNKARRPPAKNNKGAQNNKGAEKKK